MAAMSAMFGGAAAAAAPRAAARSNNNRRAATAKTATQQTTTQQTAAARRMPSVVRSASLAASSRGAMQRCHGTTERRAASGGDVGPDKEDKYMGRGGTKRDLAADDEGTAEAGLGHFSPRHIMRENQLMTTTNPTHLTPVTHLKPGGANQNTACMLHVTNLKPGSERNPTWRRAGP
jgi:hypothetical protein